MKLLRTEGVSKVTSVVESPVLPNSGNDSVSISGEDDVSMNQEKGVEDPLNRRSLESVPSPGVGH